jgi:Mn-dependent DtxR family transcriptional regulator
VNERDLLSGTIRDLEELYELHSAMLEERRAQHDALERRLREWRDRLAALDDVAEKPGLEGGQAVTHEAAATEEPPPELRERIPVAQHKERVLMALLEMGGEATTHSIAGKLGVSTARVSSWLNELRLDAKVTRRAQGLYALTGSKVNGVAETPSDAELGERALEWLRNCSSASSSEVAARCGLNATVPRITSVLRDMESRGLVRRNAATASWSVVPEVLDEVRQG